MTRRLKPVAVPPPSTFEPSRSTVLACAALLILAGLLTYANALSGPFFLDDLETISQNEQIRQLWPPSAVLFPARELPVAGRPLVNVSFALNYAFGGFDVRGYHIVNVGLHIACALLLFGVVRRTLSLPSFAGRFAGTGTVMACATALLWLVHPLQSEAVDYVTERTEIMMALFYLVTLYASIRAYESKRWLVVAVTSCLLGMASKESMATAPLMVMLFDRTFVYASFADAWRHRWKLYAALAATWILLALLLMSGPRSRSTGFSTGVSPWTYLLNQAALIVRYLRLTFWPSGLVVMYGVPQPLTLWQVLPQFTLIAALLAVTVAAFRSYPAFGFLGAWFFVTLAPTSSILPIATEVGAERRMYLPLAALVAMAIAAAWHARLRPMVRLVLLAGLAIAFATTTILRNREYSSALSLAQTVMSRWPTPRAQHWLGAELLAAGRREEALAELRAALPGEPRTHYTLGLASYQDGRFTEAVEHLRAFIAVEPSRIEVPEARETIGRALQRLGKPDEAAGEFRAALTMAPSNADLHGLLADALLQQQRFDEAIGEYQQYLRRHPVSVDALMNLGIAYVSTGRSAEAIAAFEKAVQADPRHPGARRNLARALLDAGRFGDALPHAEAAVGLAPADPVAYDELGLALAGGRRFPEAIAAYQRSLQLDPNDPEVREHLSTATRAKDAIIAAP